MILNNHSNDKNNKYSTDQNKNKRNKGKNEDNVLKVKELLKDLSKLNKKVRNTLNKTSILKISQPDLPLLNHLMLAIQIVLPLREMNQEDLLKRNLKNLNFNQCNKHKDKDKDSHKSKGIIKIKKSIEKS